MGVSSKGRRTILCNGRKYVWFVSKEECSRDRDILHILSEDKRLVLSCPLNNAVVYVVSQGCWFQGQKTDGCWNRYLLPIDIPEGITPKTVAKLIEWASGEQTAVKIDYNGAEIWY